MCMKVLLLYKELLMFYNFVSGFFVVDWYWRSLKKSNLLLF